MGAAQRFLRPAGHVHADPQGQSLPVFGLAALLEFELLPRRPHKFTISVHDRTDRSAGCSSPRCPWFEAALVRLRTRRHGRGQSQGMRTVQRRTLRLEPTGSSYELRCSACGARGRVGAAALREIARQALTLRGGVRIEPHGSLRRYDVDGHGSVGGPDLVGTVAERRGA